MATDGPPDRILVVAPHPDDESIGCGGTLALHVARGDQVHVLFLTSGDASGSDAASPVTGALREQEAECAARVLGLGPESLTFWREQDGRLRAEARIVRRLTALMEELVPNTVYVSHRTEQHPDHRAAARTVIRAVRALTASLPRVFMYEVWTPLQEMDEIVDITSVIDVKRRAIRCHESQCRYVDFEASSVGLARYRGELHCWPEGDYAEVFVEAKI